MRVLVAEDDERIRKGLIEILETEGYETLEASNGEEALLLFAKERPSFVCLDIMMPGQSGYDVCREIRKSDSDIPIIFISAKSEEVDKVLGLELGADDYILKPFGVREVVARIRAVTRRYMKRSDVPKQVESFEIGDVVVYPDELRAVKSEKEIDLSLRDVKILQFFSDNQGKVLDRDSIFDACWGLNYFPNSRTLDQHISKLRKKIESEPKDPKIIETVHGAGYRYPTS